MKTVDHLTQEQLSYLCSKIPVAVAKKYLLKFPEDFQRLEKGFRVKSLSDEQVARILLRHYRDRFIKDFLNRYLDTELLTIKTLLDHQVSDEEDQEVFLEALGDSIFDENVALFFQLTEQVRSKEFIELMEASIRREKRLKKGWLTEKRETVEEKDDALADLKEHVSKSNGREEKLKKDIKKQAAQLEAYKKESADSAKVVAELASKVDGLVSAIVAVKARMDKMDEHLLKNDEKQADLYREWQKVKEGLKVNERVDAMEEKVTKLAKQNDQIKSALKKVGEKQEPALEVVEDSRAASEEAKKKPDNDEKPSLPKRPRDMVLFEEFLEYNLTSMGLKESDAGYDAFLRYVETVAFEGIPLLVKTAPATNLANSFANILDERLKAESIYYDPEAPFEEFKKRLDKSTHRVLCIHNVIGSGEELSAVDLLQNYRDKIILLTYTADRTLYYLPHQVLFRVHYLNFDGYEALSQVRSTTECPSRMDEEVYEPEARVVAPVKQAVFREIGSQCGFYEEAIQRMSGVIEDGETLDSVLLFSMLPYVSKALRLNPFAESKRLERYVGAEENSSLKRLMLEWFDQ